MPERFVFSSTFLFPLTFWIFLAFLTLSGRDVSWVLWTAPFWMPAVVTLAVFVLVALFCAGATVFVIGALLYAARMSDAVDPRHTDGDGVTDNTRKGTSNSVPYENTSERKAS